MSRCVGGALCSKIRKYKVGRLIRSCNKNINNFVKCTLLLLLGVILQNRHHDRYHVYMIPVRTHYSQKCTPSQLSVLEQFKSFNDNKRNKFSYFSNTHLPFILQSLDQLNDSGGLPLFYYVHYVRMICFVNLVLGLSAFPSIFPLIIVIIRKLFLVIHMSYPLFSLLSPIVVFRINSVPSILTYTHLHFLLYVSNGFLVFFSSTVFQKSFNFSHIHFKYYSCPLFAP